MKVVFVVGPTASGKTKLAIDLAKKYGGEIISCDSIQVYEGLNVGSSKPSLEEQAGIKHHLLSIAKKGEKYTAGDFRRDTLATLERSQAPMMWVVGGTGFYFKALEFGMPDNPKMTGLERQAFEVEWQESGVEKMYQELQAKDPLRASEISPHDSYRIFRAVEILRLGVKPSELKKDFLKKDFPYPLFKIGIEVERSVLRQRIFLRAQEMIAAGLIHEVEGLRDQGLKDWDPLQSVGYKEVNDFLDGRITEKDLLPSIVTKTMQLAKRQMTWFRKDREIHWIKPETTVSLEEGSLKTFLRK